MTWNGFNGSRIITFFFFLLCLRYTIARENRHLFSPPIASSKESVKSTQRSYRININRLFFFSPRVHTTVCCIFIKRLESSSITNAAREISFRKASSSSSSFLCSCLRSRVMADHRGHLALPLYFPSKSDPSSIINFFRSNSNRSPSICLLQLAKFQIKRFFFSRTKEKEERGQYDAQLSLDKDLSWRMPGTLIFFLFFFFV